MDPWPQANVGKKYGYADCKGQSEIPGQKSKCSSILNKKQYVYPLIYWFSKTHCAQPLLLDIYHDLGSLVPKLVGFLLYVWVGFTWLYIKNTW